MLTGCATQAQKQHQQMQTQLQYTLSENKRCQAEMKKEEAHQRVEATLISGENDPNAIKKMLINRVATQAEKEDLMVVYDRLAVCRKNTLNNLGSVHPDFVALLARWYSENDETLVMILKEEVTIGAANEVLNKRFAKRNDEWNAVANGIYQQLQTSYQIEMANRQRAAAAMQQWNYQQQLQQNQQLINSLNRPTTTNCYQVGNNINCTNY
jgi:hypothetical protein